MGRRRRFAAVDPVCAQQSALEPASSRASDIAVLWWIMLSVAAVVFLVVMAVLILGQWRSRRRNGGSLSLLPASRNLRETYVNDAANFSRLTNGVTEEHARAMAAYFRSLQNR